MTTDITEVRPASAQLDVAVPARSRHLGLALVVISMAQLMRSHVLAHGCP
jgi:hypothetical protein